MRYNPTPDGSGSAAIAFKGLTGTVRIAPNGSGDLTLNDPRGPVTAQWNAQGQGTLTLADGMVVPIADFDAED